MFLCRFFSKKVLLSSSGMSGRDGEITEWDMLMQFVEK
jgi:hypothetical protein